MGGGKKLRLFLYRPKYPLRPGSRSRGFTLSAFRVGEPLLGNFAGGCGGSGFGGSSGNCCCSWSLDSAERTRGLLLLNVLTSCCLLVALLAVVLLVAARLSGRNEASSMGVVFMEVLVLSSALSAPAVETLDLDFFNIFLSRLICSPLMVLLPSLSVTPRPGRTLSIMGCMGAISSTKSSLTVTFFLPLSVVAAIFFSRCFCKGDVLPLSFSLAFSTMLTLTLILEKCYSIFFAHTFWMAALLLAPFQ